MCLAACVQAKNATMSRNGITPEQAVFGRSLKLTELSNTDDDQILVSVPESHGLAFKASWIRTAANIKLLQRDVMDKLRRAI